MITVRRAAALAAACLSIAAGVWTASDRPDVASRQPGWALSLAPLADAPIPPGSMVALQLPMGQSRRAAAPLLMEAAWRRPDLRWAWLNAWPGRLPPEFLVIPDGEFSRSPWRETWQAGGIHLLRRPQS